MVSRARCCGNWRFFFLGNRLFSGEKTVVGNRSGAADGGPIFELSGSIVFDMHGYDFGHGKILYDGFERAL